MTYAKARFLTVFSSLTLAALSSACLETQYPHCDETVTVLDSLDAPTPAGVTPGEILAVIEGERVAELEYVEDDGSDVVHVEISPGGEGSTDLSLSLGYEGGELRWIDAEEVYPTGPGPTVDIAVDCPDRLEIDARMDFVTGDGVFDEWFDVTVRTELDHDGKLGLARIIQAFDPAELVGALEVLSITPENPERVDYQLEVQYPLSEEYVSEGGAIGQPLGEVGGGAEYRHGKGPDAGVSYGVFTIATFGGWDLGF